MKASDVHRETNYVFSKKVPFKEAFPQIKSVKVSVEESGHLTLGRWSHEPNTRIYDEKHLGEYIDCSNPLCYNGGFSIGQILREMVVDKKTHLETVKACQGYEGSPKGKINRGRCVNFFKIAVDIDYNP
jgi:hypothetical protein